MKTPTTYTYHCNQCGFQMDALSPYQRKVIRDQHRASRMKEIYPGMFIRGNCPRGVAKDYDGNLRIVRQQIQGDWNG